MATQPGVGAVRPFVCQIGLRLDEPVPLGDGAAMTSAGEAPEGVFRPRDENESRRMAQRTVSQMTRAEKLSFVVGDRSFFIRAIERLGVPEVYMTDATCGIHLREAFDGHDLQRYQPEQSTAFPCPLALAATWNVTQAYAYAEAVGRECRAQGIGILLGPGLNMYRHAQCGRNFEYMGEDPHLTGQMGAAYVRGLQSTGTMATLKHFVANNTDWFRRKSNSKVSERALREIYTPAFEAGIQAGARAVMTAYNLVNGQWCGESKAVIADLLRTELAFPFMVMTDWWSTYNGKELVESGQDLEMPHAVALQELEVLVDKGAVNLRDIEQMCERILMSVYSMRPACKDPNPEVITSSPSESPEPGCSVSPPSPMSPTACLVDFDHHVEIARETARQGVVLLHNNGTLPLALETHGAGLLLTGSRADVVPQGGGSSRVTGFANKSLHEALEDTFAVPVALCPEPSDAALAAASTVICAIGTQDSEGWDRPFELPEPEAALVQRCVQANPRTVVVVYAGGGCGMKAWAGRAAALLYAWYPGQAGNAAVAEILAGVCNPSGKLPITIEQAFSDSPGAHYLPSGESLYEGFRDEEEKLRPVWDLPYDEDVFIGYRWYQNRGIQPLFPFGHGLSYTRFAYSDLIVQAAEAGVEVTFTVRNVGARAGAEIAQIYVEDVACTVARPPLELKGFVRLQIEAGDLQRASVTLDRRAFSFWHPADKGWRLEPGLFRIHVGASSADLRLVGEMVL